MAELTYERVLELFAETDRRFEQRIESNAISREKERIERELASEKERVQRAKEMDKMMKDLGKKISDLGDTLGRFAEEQVRADLLNKFEKWGIPVHAITNHFVQRDKNNEYAYEVDILIYNSKYVVAIGVKNTLKTDDIDDHLDRMKKMQELPLPATKGKNIVGSRCRYDCRRRSGQICGKQRAFCDKTQWR